MNKVIRLDKQEYEGSKYNKLFEINNELARAKGLVTLDYIPLRWSLRHHIIQRCNEKKDIIAEVSHKDIKRMEKSQKCQVPINIIDILEVIIDEIIKCKKDFNYRANDEYIISIHMLYNTIDSLKNLIAWLETHDEGIRPECDKYRDAVLYVKGRLEEFDVAHPELFNELFN